MKIGIMQPYLFPYIGYFQLMNAVDEFVVYDNIQFTKKGWINRNRILVNGNDTFITVPIKQASDYFDIRDRYLADTWSSDRKKMINRIIEAYKKSPLFDYAFPVIEKAILFEESNLFKFIFNSLKLIKEYLSIRTEIIISSSIPVDHALLKAEEKVIAICKAKNAATYINPIGGAELYNKNNFSIHGIELQFLQAKYIVYNQCQNEFIPWLSIIDVMMFNNKEKIQNFVNNEYTLN